MTGANVTNTATRGRSSGPPSEPHAPRFRPRHHAYRTEQRGVWFIIPFLIVFLLFMVVPLAYAIYQSLYTVRLVGGRSFTGLANYKQIFTSGQYWSGIVHVIIFGAIQIPIMLAIAFFFASIFDIGLARLGGFFRALFFIPFAVPQVVAAIMWQFLLEPKFGPFSHLAAVLGFGSVNFFSSGLIWPTIFVIVIWEWTGYNTIILYTALKSVPRDVVEAALLDGAGLWAIVTKIKLALVRPAIVMLVFLNIIGALQLFVEPTILSEFHPEAITDYFTPIIFIYNTGIAGQQYNLAAAAAVVLGLVIVAISVSVVLFRHRRRELS